MISEYTYINIELNEITKQGAYGSCVLFSNGACSSSMTPTNGKEMK
jgi:hypothetical protein